MGDRSTRAELIEENGQLRKRLARVGNIESVYNAGAASADVPTSDLEAQLMKLSFMHERLLDRLDAVVERLDGAAVPRPVPADDQECVATPTPSCPRPGFPDYPQMYEVTYTPFADTTAWVVKVIAESPESAVRAALEAECARRREDAGFSRSDWKLVGVIASADRW